MDLRHLRAFVTVAEEGSVSRAALRLHITQPALSRQVASLERDLGLALFDRVGRRLVLTSEGEQLVSDCQGLLNFARALGEQAQRLRRGDSGILKVAASPHLIEGVFGEFLHVYAGAFPNVQVKLVDAVGPDMLALLERGELDLAQSLVRAIPPDERRFGSHLLPSVDILAACHAELKLGSGGSIDIGQLAPYPLLQIGPEFVIRKTFDAACRLAGMTPRTFLESRAPHALLALAEAGHGVAIIPSALRTHHYRLRIVRITHRGEPLSERLTILFNKRRPLPPYAKAFCEMFGAHLREIFPITRPSEPGRKKAVVPAPKRRPRASRTAPRASGGAAR